MWPDGRKYVGKFKDNYFNGKGTLSWIDGKTYEGEFKDSLPSNEGIFIFSNGSKHKGKLSNISVRIEGIWNNSQAEKVTLKIGDIIKEYNNITVSDEKFLKDMISQTKHEEKIKLKIIRNGNEKQFLINGGEIGIHYDNYFSSLLPTNIGNNKRFALIIGNGNYIYGGKLANPVNDARAIKNALEKLNFAVIKYENCDQKTMNKAIDDFGESLKNVDVALFFYAGHGVQVSGNNYLIPTETKLKNENDAEYDCVRADRILAKMENAGSKTNIVILDACRDNPFERSWRRNAKGNGLAFMNAPSGSLIAYATSPGKTASDGTGANGLYTSALLRYIKIPNLKIEDIFKRVRKTVINESGNKQTPWESTSLTGDFYFIKQQ
ncbi:caspase family protein [Desulfobacterales bacterium HSG17]|nr:caspase family protein [Desulfobacterales bacterium HSG17]